MIHEINDLGFRRTEVSVRFFALCDYSNRTGCWPWTGTTDAAGYGRFNLLGKITLSHRAAMILTGKQIPKNMVVLHTCDNPSCVNPDHLRIGTQGDNMRDAYDKGRKSNAGENHPKTSLTWDEISGIREEAQGGATVASIARDRRMPDSTVRSIVSGRNWRE